MESAAESTLSARGRHRLVAIDESMAFPSSSRAAPQGGLRYGGADCAALALGCYGRTRAEPGSARVDLGEEPEQRLGEPLRALEARHVGDVRQVDPAGAGDPGREHARRAPASTAMSRPPTIARIGTRDLAQAPDGRRIEHDRCRRTASPGRTSRRPSSAPLADRGGRPSRAAARRRRPRSPTSRSAIAAQSFASASASSRLERGLLLGRLLDVGAAEATADPDEARDAIRDTPAPCRCTIEPAREHPTSTARSRPAASITATRSARLENARARRLRPAEPAQVVADDAVAGSERVPLRVPLAHVGDPRVGEHHAVPSPGHLDRQPPARDVDEALELVGHRVASRSRYTAVPIGRRQWVVDIAWR